MVLPPLAAGYWFAALGVFCVFCVFLAILKELCSNSSYNQKINNDRQALKGPKTTVPSLQITDSGPWTFQKTQFLAFTCHQNPSETVQRPTEERKLIRSFFEKIDIDVETIIPKGATTVSYAYEGFQFGDSCLEFRPTQSSETDFLKFSYQMICSRVQNVYCNDTLAGTCLYFDSGGTEVEKSKRFSETEYNLMAFYDTVTQKTRQEVTEARKAEKLAKKARRCEEEPLKEYTSTIFSHLRLFTEKSGRTVVLACNADGKMEKYTFNERIDRYEYVETEENLEELIGDNFLVRRY